MMENALVNENFVRMRKKRSLLSRQLKLENNDGIVNESTYYAVRYFLTDICSTVVLQFCILNTITAIRSTPIS